MLKLFYWLANGAVVAYGYNSSYFVQQIGVRLPLAAIQHGRLNVTIAPG